MSGLPTIFALTKAVEASIPCLVDWCNCTGFGEVFRRDSDALQACLDALDELRDENAKYGVLTAGSAAWPQALEIIRRGAA